MKKFVITVAFFAAMVSSVKAEEQSVAPVVGVFGIPFPSMEACLEGANLLAQELGIDQSIRAPHMLTWTTVPIVAALAVIIGYGVGRMPCWKPWQGYASLLIVAPLGIVISVPWTEVVVDCTGLGAGFALARR